MAPQSETITVPLGAAFAILLLLKGWTYEVTIQGQPDGKSVSLEGKST